MDQFLGEVHFLKTFCQYCSENLGTPSIFVSLSSGEGSGGVGLGPFMLLTVCHHFASWQSECYHHWGVTG